MKVPVYTAQIRMARPQRGPQLSVSASPSGLSQDSRALASFGQELASQSLDLYSRFLGEQRQQQLNDAEIPFEEELAQYKLDTVTEDPSVTLSKGPKGFKARSEFLLTKYTDLIEDSVVRRRFKNRGRVTLANANITVNNNARKKSINNVIQAEYNRANQLAEKLADPSQGPNDKADARLELFGIDGDGNTVGIGIFESLEQRGLISATERETQIRAAKAYEQSREFDYELIKLDAMTMGNPGGATNKAIRAYNDLIDGKTGTDLTVTDRLNLAQKFINIAQAATSVDEANEASDAAAVKLQNTANQDSNEAELFNKIVLAEEFPNDDQYPMPNITAIANAAVPKNGSAGISQNFASSMIERIRNSGKITDDRATKIAFTNDIVNAKNAANKDERFQNLQRDLYVEMGNQNLTTASINSLMKLLNSERNAHLSAQSSSEARDKSKRWNQYYKLTSQKAGADVNGNPFLSSDDNSVGRVHDALETYTDLTMNKDVPPLEAYEYIKANLPAAERYNFPFLGPNPELAKFLPNHIQRLFNSTTNENEKEIFENLTFEMLQTLKDNLTETGLSPTLQDIELTTLNDLGTALTDFYNTEQQLFFEDFEETLVTPMSESIKKQKAKLRAKK